jgi:hypothetical protein
MAEYDGQLGSSSRLAVRRLLAALAGISVLATPNMTKHWTTRGIGSIGSSRRHSWEGLLSRIKRSAVTLTCMGLDVSGFIRFDTVPERAGTGGAVYGGGGAQAANWSSRLLISPLQQRSLFRRISDLQAFHTRE